jgi:hypothetical protein
MGPPPRHAHNHPSVCTYCKMASVRVNEEYMHNSNLTIVEHVQHVQERNSSSC